MKLISLRLRNFRQHRDSSLNFHSGVTAILGPNGSGKTTILEAITFALYGEQRSKKETIRFAWAELGEKFSVELVFDFGGGRYRVMRDEKTAEFSLTSDPRGPQTLAKGLTDVSSYSRRLLQLSYSQFINSFCAEQKKLKFMNFDQSSKLQDEIARMLGFDRLKLSADSARERAKNEKMLADALEHRLGSPTELEEAKDRAEVDLQSAEKALRASTSRKLELTDRESKLRALREKAEAHLAVHTDMAGIAERATGLKEAVKLAEAAVTSAEADVRERDRLTPVVNETKKIAEEITRLERLREAAREREVLAGQIEVLRKRIAEEQTELDRMPNPDAAAAMKAVEEALKRRTAAKAQQTEKEQAWRATQGDAGREAAAAKTQFETMKQALDKAQRTADLGQCPECGQPIGDDYRRTLAEKAREVERLAGIAAELAKRSQDLAATPGEVEAAIRTAEEADQAHRAAQSAHEAAKSAQETRTKALAKLERERTQLVELEAKIAVQPATFDASALQELQERRRTLEPEYVAAMKVENAPARLERARAERDEAKKRLDEAKASYEALKARLDSEAFPSADTARQAIAEHERVNGDLIECSTQATNDALLRDAAKKRLDDAIARLAEYRQRKDDIEAHREANRHYVVVAKEMDALRERLNAQIKPELEARASDNLAAMTDGRYPRLVLDDDFQGTIIDEGARKPVISGGEEDIVALALRLALAELIQARHGDSKTLLILDEVFGSLDSERRMNVVECLAGLKGRFDQILVISHVDHLEDKADRCLYVRRDPTTMASVVSDVKDGDRAVASRAAVRMAEPAPDEPVDRAEEQVESGFGDVQRSLF